VSVSSGDLELDSGVSTRLFKRETKIVWLDDEISLDEVAALPLPLQPVE
jgi:hypothetical protein